MSAYTFIHMYMYTKRVLVYTHVTQNMYMYTKHVYLYTHTLHKTCTKRVHTLHKTCTCTQNMCTCLHTRYTKHVHVTQNMCTCLHTRNTKHVHVHVHKICVLVYTHVTQNMYMYTKYVYLSTHRLHKTCACVHMHKNA